MCVPDPKGYGHRAIIGRSQQERGLEFEVTLTLKPIRNCIPFVGDIPSTVSHKSPDKLRRSLSIVLGSPWDADECIKRVTSGDTVECWLLPQRRSDVLNQLRPIPEKRSA
jgi:hypothetical protein